MRPPAATSCANTLMLKVDKLDHQPYELIITAQGCWSSLAALKLCVVHRFTKAAFAAATQPARVDDQGMATTPPLVASSTALAAVAQLLAAR